MDQFSLPRWGEGLCQGCQTGVFRVSQLSHAGGPPFFDVNCLKWLHAARVHWSMFTLLGRGWPSASAWAAIWEMLDQSKKEEDEISLDTSWRRRKMDSLPELPCVIYHMCEIAICPSITNHICCGCLQTFSIRSCQALTYEFSCCLFSVLVY